MTKFKITSYTTMQREVTLMANSEEDARAYMDGDDEIDVLWISMGDYVDIGQPDHDVEEIK